MARRADERDDGSTPSASSATLWVQIPSLAPSPASRDNRQRGTAEELKTEMFWLSRSDVETSYC